jgi:MFS family permease
MSPRLFTPRFLVMCAYSFTVFISVFQLLPTAPYHVLDLGGSTTAAGLFLGCLTFSSALSAPLTGAIGDRFGQRRVLMFVSAVSAVFSLGYALITNIPFLLTVVVLHGLFWSALLSASGAYMTATIPESRRAEGISYWGMTSTIALATAPSIGFWVYQHGWWTLCLELITLNVVMAVVAWRLPDDRVGVAASHAGAMHSALPHPHLREPLTAFAASAGKPHAPPRRIVDWRVLILAMTMALISFGYGALTSFSALFADALHITPRGLFLMVMAGAMLAIRLMLGRSIDGFGHRRVLVMCLAAPAAGLLVLASANGPIVFITAAVLFGLGMSLMYPAFTAYILRHVAFNRRGAAFGAMLCAYDTGVGSGSSVTGWLIHRFGYRPAFIVAGLVALLALPYFLVAERQLGFKDSES